MTIHCPCCGQSVNVDKASIDALSDISMEPRMRVVVDALARVFPRSVSITYLTDALYAADPNGGPDNPGNSIRVYISRLRKILPQYGWTIPSNRSGFGAHSRYRLEPVSQKDKNSVDGSLDVSPTASGSSRPIANQEVSS